MKYNIGYPIIVKAKFTKILNTTIFSPDKLINPKNTMYAISKETAKAIHSEINILRSFIED